MMPLWVAIPVGAIFLIYLAVIAAAGVALMAAPFFYAYVAIRKRQWMDLFGVVVFGSLMMTFGWVILYGSTIHGGAILEGLLTRIAG